jgi:hypothetical protein
MRCTLRACIRSLNVERAAATCTLQCGMVARELVLLQPNGTSRTVSGFACTYDDACTVRFNKSWGYFIERKEQPIYLEPGPSPKCIEHDVFMWIVDDGHHWFMYACPEANCDAAQDYTFGTHEK